MCVQLVYWERRPKHQAGKSEVISTFQARVPGESVLVFQNLKLPRLHALGEGYQDSDGPRSPNKKNIDKVTV